MKIGKTKPLVRMIMCLLFIIVTFSALKCSNSEQLKEKKYYAAGMNLYNQYCSNCHMANGLGFSKLIPPITESRLFKNKEDLVCLIKNGSSNSKTYNMSMPGYPNMKNEEIAQIITYITNSWGNKNPLYKEDSVLQAQKECRNYKLKSNY